MLKKRKTILRKATIFLVAAMMAFVGLTPATAFAEDVSDDTEKVNAVKTKFDSEFGALRPDFATDKNINDLVLSKIRGDSDTDTTGVTTEQLRKQLKKYKLYICL